MRSALLRLFGAFVSAVLLLGPPILSEVIYIVVGRQTGLDGRLVGIITFYRRGADDYSFFAIPAERIETLPFSAVTARAEIVPFWMRKHGDQPQFLQVVTFEADKDWKSMVRAARAW